MWLLSCDGELFGGKRLWLRPGSTHLLGRTTGKAAGGERIRYIEHKTVSRKHLTITVHPVATGSSSKLHQRSKVELKDGSKIGTYINDEKIVQTNKTLDGSVEVTLKLGHYEHLFHLVWKPVVLSCSGGFKPKEAQRQVLEGADIKLLKDYVSNETTHSVARKRNTAANLQALAQGRWLVSDGFVEAIRQAVTAGSAGDASPLEDDFDAGWPKEADYLVPSGSEPVPRPDRFCLPNPQRAEVFSDFSFLFLLQSQYDTLLPVITGGGGKALLWEMEAGQSKVEDALDYIKTVGGLKGSSQFKPSQWTGPGGIVVVQPSERDGALNEFMDAVEIAIQQRPMEQNELLDVILCLDTSTLTQPTSKTPAMLASGREASPPPAPTAPEQPQRAVTVNETPSAQEEPPHDEQAPQEQQGEQEEQPATVSRRRHRRYITQSRFQGFDDVDPSQFSKPASQSPAPSSDQMDVSQAPSAQDMDVGEPSKAPRTQQHSRKRPAPQVEVPDEEAMYAELLPAHAAMKRRKTEAAAQNGDRLALVAKHVAAEKAQAKKKKAKNLDVMAEVQKRREKEEEERRKDEESLRNAMEGVDLKDLKNLAQVEEMEVRVRDRPIRASREGRGNGRWNPAWNGRKNFKKFRPRGSVQTGPRLQRVIVTLEEAPRKGHGIGDEYWLQTSRTSKSKSQSQSQGTRQAATQQSQRAGAGADDEHEDSAQFRRRIQRSRQEDEEEARAAELHPEEIAGRARDEALQAAVHGTPSQTLRSESQRKRPAGTEAVGGPAKRAKQSRIGAVMEAVSLEHDDDDDELKFRRRRR